MNQVMLLGRITKDPELKTTNTGKKYVMFAVACDRPKMAGQDRAEVDFINCVAWEKTAELISKYFSKGSRILCEGSWRNRSYDKNGTKVNVSETLVNRIEFVDSRSQSRQEQQSSSFDAFGPSGAFDEEIPF